MDDYELLHLRNELARILNDAQRNVLSHKICLVSSLQLFDNSDSEQFELELLKMMNRILVASTKIHDHTTQKKLQSPTNNILSSQQSQEENNITPSILEYLSDVSQAEDKSARLRSCLFISSTLNFITEDIEENLWDELKQCLLIRAQDKIPQIRAAAVTGLRRLHDPSNPKDRCIKEFIRILENDVQKEVRKAVVKNIGISDITIPILIERTKDVAPEVRTEVFRTFNNAQSTKFLKAFHLVDIFENGLNDRNPGVVKNCQKIITKYISKTPILKFVSSLDPQLNQNLVEKVLQFIVSNKKFDFMEIEMDEKYSVEYNILRRVFLQKACSDGNEDYDDQLPEIYDICKQILLTYEQEEFFDLKQLLFISSSLDYSNEAGRRKMSTILRNILQEIQELDIHEQLVKLIRKLHPDESDFLQIVLEILADIMDPLDQSEDENEISNTNTVQDNIFVKALSICEEILRYTSKTISHPGINGLLQNYIIPSMSHIDCIVREKALSSLGLYCLLDVNEAIKYLLLFVKVIDSAEPDNVQLIAVRTLFDFLTLFGPETLIKQEKEWPKEFQVWNEEDDEEDDEDTSDSRSFTLVTLVRCLTQTKNTLIRSTAVEGFAKLLLNNFINDFQIISILITLYFHPATDRDQNLTQCLGVFFPAYCLNSPKHAETLKEAFVPTLERILSSSQFSPLRKVDIEKVVQFIIMHIDMSYSRKSPNDLPGHDDLAASCAQLVLDNLNSNNEMSKNLCKVLSSMRIKDYDSSVSARLSSLMVRLIDKISEKPLQRVLNNIQNILHKSIKKKRSRSPSAKYPPTKKRRINSPERVSPPPKSKSSSRKRKRSPSLSKNTSPKKKQKLQLLTTHDIPSSPPNNIEDIIDNPEEELTPKTKVVISFSGFSMTDPEFDYTYLHALVKDAKKLGAELVLGNVIDSSITHIVSPPNRRTMKTIVGSLTNKWIVNPEWLTRSAKAGKFLREELYGGKTTSKPFRDKTVFISTKFVEENPNKQFNLPILKNLITQAGKGKIISKEEHANFVLCSKNAKKSNHNITYLTWKDFFEYLQPTVNIL